MHQQTPDNTFSVDTQRIDRTMFPWGKYSDMNVIALLMKTDCCFTHITDLYTALYTVLYT